MALKGYFYNSVNKDRLYNGEDMNEDKAPFYKEGVVYGHLAVTAGEGMTVKVDGGPRTGYAYINLHTIHNTTVLELQVSQAGGTLPRIDRVILRNDETERKPSIFILEGAYSSVPQPPALTNTDVIQEKCLAEIYVAAGAVKITQADITDTRADTTICGFIASQFVDIDFSQFTLQFNSWFAQEKESIEKDHADFIEEYAKLTQDFMNNQAIAWNNWFAFIKNQLKDDVIGAILDKINANEKMISEAFAPEQDYVDGDYCIYNNTLYKFITRKNAGDWDETAVQKTNICAEFKDALGGLKLRKISEQDYQNLPDKGKNTVYFSPEEG